MSFQVKSNPYSVQRLKGTVARDLVWLKVVPFDRYKQGELPLKVLKFLNYSYDFIFKFQISSHFYENQL